MQSLKKDALCERVCERLREGHDSGGDKVVRGKELTLCLEMILLADPPTPSGLPVIGHLHLLRAYKENPWEGFDKIRQDFGDIVQLRLGIHKTVMVSTGELMREVLLTKGDIFSNRPNFNRYQIIFGGDRENCKFIEMIGELLFLA